ncbi:MAG: response regulator [Methylococcales bacterium]|jgi:CheY-like chemotaxis protein|nr:response regulator [Methylococcales bacterium]MBT7410855.1 response regulator [Methylococcales bacterium]
MPIKDGYEATRDIRQEKDGKDVPIIALTANVFVEDKKVCVDVGMTAYYEKPYNKEIFNEILSGQYRSSSLLHNIEKNQQLSDKKHPFKILIVDDNKINLLVIEAMLKPLNTELELAVNGVDAVAKNRMTQFDVILMDCQMPEMDGYEATSVIRQAEIKTGSHVPIIALTANSGEEYKKRCLDSGMDAFVAKPVLLDELMAALSSWLDEFDERMYLS